MSVGLQFFATLFCLHECSLCIIRNHEVSDCDTTNDLTYFKLYSMQQFALKVSLYN